MANCGYTWGLVKWSFSSVSLREITADPFDSDPVAGSVSTHPSGTARSTGAPFAGLSHGSAPLNGTAAATNFVPSSTEPAADREEEIDLLLADDRHGAHQRPRTAGWPLDAAELARRHGPGAPRDLLVHAVPL